MTTPAHDDTTTINEEGARALYDACRQAFLFLTDLRTEDLLPIVMKKGAISVADLAEKLCDALDLARKGERRAPRVLIELFMGIPDVKKEPGVNVCVVDFDQGQEVPAAFEDMATKRSAAT